MPTVYIAAECHSDDRASEVSFDAIDWFESAEDSELIELAECGWGGGYAADAIADWMENRNEEVADMFKYIHARNKVSRESIGFECSIDDSVIALEWIQSNRERAYEKIAELSLT